MESLLIKEFVHAQTQLNHYTSKPVWFFQIHSIINHFKVFGIPTSNSIVGWSKTSNLNVINAFEIIIWKMEYASKNAQLVLL